MVVGSFTSVSQDPPLVGFLPMVSSGTWQQIREHGRFSVSVLGADHARLCRDFFSGAARRFNDPAWAPNPDGIPRLRQAVAWFDCVVSAVHPAGDHDFVIGEVLELGLGEDAAGALPLLFLNGGYGSFTVPALDYDVSGIGDRLRHADALRELVQSLADEANRECVLTTVTADQVAILTAANLRSALVGVTFPFAAPIAPVFAAWAPADRVQLWSENARHLLGTSDADFIADLLRQVRDRGYAVSVGAAMRESFDAIIGSPTTHRSELAGLWAQVQADYRELQQSDTPESVVSSVQFPVFGAEGHAELELVVSGFEEHLSKAEYAGILAATARRSAEMTRLIGGRFPTAYPLQPTPPQPESDSNDSDLHGPDGRLARTHHR